MPAPFLLALFSACVDQFQVQDGATVSAAIRQQGLQAEAPFRAVAIDRAKMRPLEGFGELLWIDGGAVVADASLVGDLPEVDATRLADGEQVVMTKLTRAGKARPPREFAKWLMRSGLLRTYWHIESAVCQEAEESRDGAWAGRYSGEHVYFTNSRNTGRFAFTVRIAADGTVTVTGR